MIEKNKSLIIKKDKIIYKIINFFKNLFRKNKQEIIEKENNNFANEPNTQNKNNFNDEKQKEKERFFNLYENVKKGIVDVKSLKGADLIQINQMLKLELKLNKEKT